MAEVDDTATQMCRDNAGDMNRGSAPAKSRKIYCSASSKMIWIFGDSGERLSMKSTLISLAFFLAAAASAVAASSGSNNTDSFNNVGSNMGNNVGNGGGNGAGSSGGNGVGNGVGNGKIGRITTPASTSTLCCKDLNGDGHADIVWRDNTGEVYVW